MLEEKQGQFWNLHQIPNKTSYPDFRFFLLFCCFYQFFDSFWVIFFDSFWALIVFELFSFEGSKKHFTGETNMYIYAYIEYY